MKNNKELVEAGLKLASSLQSTSNYATEYLDRTIYHTVYVTDAEGKTLIDGEGNPVIRNQVLYLAGSYLSKAELHYAEEVEAEFKVLNDRLRKQMDSEGVVWRLKKTNQRALQITGVTGL